MRSGLKTSYSHSSSSSFWKRSTLASIADGRGQNATPNEATKKTQYSTRLSRLSFQPPRRTISSPQIASFGYGSKNGGIISPRKTAQPSRTFSPEWGSLRLAEE
mmetsp:Transcript_22563/g.25385  ORF Transcript_22563/g.25385 Transcript_22563/m.25385 type:complete len:104 (+) Transcript_22563:613-924(+)